jgi:hypothetical protein
MNINKRYKELTRNKASELNVSVSAHIPTPTDADFTKGYVTRYFTQKTNDLNSPIFEVSQKEFARLSSSIVYVTTSLRWRLKGPKESVYDANGKMTDKGVKESNRRSTELASVVIKKLNLYLPNTTQFNKF